jgi:hypothetical protein
MAAASTRPSAATACSICAGVTVTKLSRSVLWRGAPFYCRAPGT